jgi:large subunit ribosomal protein L21
MYAILETGGKQYKVRPGDTLRVEKLQAAPGETVTLDRVLLLAEGDDVEVGRPVVAGARVLAEVVDQGRGPKIIVFKYKAKVRYRRKTGHRQSLTTLRVKEIQGAGSNGT